MTFYELLNLDSTQRQTAGRALCAWCRGAGCKLNTYKTDLHANTRKLLLKTDSKLLKDASAKVYSEIRATLTDAQIVNIARSEIDINNFISLSDIKDNLIIVDKSTRKETLKIAADYNIENIPADQRPVKGNSCKIYNWREPVFYEMAREYSPCDKKLFSAIKITSGLTHEGLVYLIQKRPDALEYTTVAQSKTDSLQGLREALDVCLAPNGESLKKYMNDLLDSYKAGMRDWLQEYLRSDEYAGTPEDVCSEIVENCRNSFLKSIIYSNQYALPVLIRERNLMVPSEQDSSDLTLVKMPFLEHIADSHDAASLFLSSYSEFSSENLYISDWPEIYSNDRNTPCLNFYDLEEIRSIPKDQDYPTWEEALKDRFNDEEAAVFRAYIWSVFDARNVGRQILYLWDDGHSGKSVMLNVIAEELGQAAQAMQKDSLEGRFAMAKYYDKHLIVVCDNSNTNLIKLSKLKSITGRDRVEVELKGKVSFTARVYCKIIANSNYRPNIDADSTAETSRVILIKLRMDDEKMRAKGLLSPTGERKGDPTWEPRLKAEFKAFLRDCEQDYIRLCPKHADIELPQSMIDAINNCGNEFKQSIDSDTFEMILNDMGYTLDSAGKCLRRNLLPVINQYFAEHDKTPLSIYRFREILDSNFRGSEDLNYKFGLRKMTKSEQIGYKQQKEKSILTAEEDNEIVEAAETVF